MRIQLDTEFRNLQKDLYRLETKQLNTAIVRAINKVGDRVFSASRKMMAKEGGIKPLKKLDRYIKKFRAARNRQYFDIVYSKGYFSLYRDFGATQTKKGVQSKPWGERQTYPGAFIATVGVGGHRDVFKRIGGRRGPKRRVLTGKNIGKLYQPELPIKQLFGPSVLGMYRKLKIEDVAQKIVADDYQKEFRRALRSIGVNA